MFNLTLYTIFFATLLAMTLVAFAKYKPASPEFRPMLAFSWLLLLFECFRVFFEKGSAVHNFAYNTHYLFEMLVVCWIGWRWKYFAGRPMLFRILVLFILAVWTTEKLVFGWGLYISWGRVVFAILITLLAMDFLHRAFFRESRGRQKNAILLFCIAMGVSFLVNAFFEIAAALVNTPTPNFVQNMFYFSVAIGLLFNLTVLTSYLCISTKQKYSLA